MRRICICLNEESTAFRLRHALKEFLRILKLILQGHVLRSAGEAGIRLSQLLEHLPLPLLILFIHYLIDFSEQISVLFVSRRPFAFPFELEHALRLSAALPRCLNVDLDRRVRLARAWSALPGKRRQCLHSICAFFLLAIVGL